MKVEIYGAEWCSVCKQALQLCESREIEYDYIDVDASGNMRALQQRMGAPARSIPQIFVDDQLVLGGFAGLKAKII